jgi:hypothetical protein
VWNHRLTGNYSPNSTSSSRSPLRTPRELLYTSEPPPQLAEPWQPKPRTWNEQPLFDDLKHQDHGSGNGGSSMQSYSNPIVNMDSMGGASGPSDYMTAPHPGGLGAAFPDLLPPPTQSYGYDSMPLSMPDMDPYRIADRPLVGPTEYAQVSLSPTLPYTCTHQTHRYHRS